MGATAPALGSKRRVPEAPKELDPNLPWESVLETLGIAIGVLPARILRHGGCVGALGPLVSGRSLPGRCGF